MRVLVVGSSLIDIVCRFEEKIKTRNKNLFLKLGSKYNLGLIEFSVGGSALNVACNLSNLGNISTLISRIGSDIYGNQILETLKKYRVNPLIKIDKSNTGFSIILLNNGEKIVLASKGASENLDEKDINEKSVMENDLVIATSCGKNSKRIYERLFKLCKKYNKIFVFNPSISIIKREKNLLKIFDLAELIILNEEEARALTKKNSINEASKYLLKYFKRVIITLGSKGSIYLDKTQKIYQKAYKVRVISTIGAGDSFTSGFIHYYYKYRDIKSALKFASVYAAINVSSFGSIVELKESEILNYFKLFK